MITLRSFCAEDCAFLATYYKRGMTSDEALALIDEWNRKSYQGTYFEMFAIVSDDAPVGWISLYAHSNCTISAGLEIIENARRKGFGYTALVQALLFAKQLGYQTAVAQVRKNNTASLRLHAKCGFIITGECVTTRGNEAVCLQTTLEDIKQEG